MNKKNNNSSHESLELVENTELGASLERRPFSDTRTRLWTHSHAKRRLALRLRTDPHVLAAVHW